MRPASAASKAVSSSAEASFSSGGMKDAEWPGGNNVERNARSARITRDARTTRSTAAEALNCAEMRARTRSQLPSRLSRFRCHGPRGSRPERLSRTARTTLTVVRPTVMRVIVYVDLAVGSLLLA